ncbi:MAG: hypothetical protein HKP30_17555 [Myxococcales bacterium]|nr:hypothetical protein [Myxococcales bacterium]
MRRARTLLAGPGRPMLLLPLLLAVACEKPPADGPPLPPLLASTPAAGASQVPTTSWIVLDFAAKVRSLKARQFSLACASETEFHAVRAHNVGVSRVVLDPNGPLPPDDDCVVRWESIGGPVALGFATAGQGAPFRPVHDRTDTSRVGPYPDDVHLVEDPGTRTGLRHDVIVPTATESHTIVYSALLAEANQLDGFSPIGPIVLELEDAVDPASLPATPAASLDPTSTIVLLDQTPWSVNFGRRVPVRVEARNGDGTAFGLVSNTLFVFPSIPLEPEGRYALFVTRRVLAAPDRPLAPSPYFEAVLAPPAPGEAPAVTHNRDLLADVFHAGEKLLRPALGRDELAFAARISVRSIHPIQDDVQVMKRQILAAPPPAIHVDPADPDAVEADPGDHVAALVRGTWDAPDWRDGSYLARDAEGRPVVTGTQSVCFRLALPEAALDGPVPIVMYQHGNPGESEVEVLRNATRFLAEAGYAVIGFTDVLNREVATPSSTPGAACKNYESPDASDESRLTSQVFAIVLELLANNRLADHWAQTLGDQLAFVRMIQGLDALDLLPLGAPDGVPDLDPTRLLYMGISEGGNNGQAFAAYAPEVRAAALVVGGARLLEVLIHQQAATFLEALPLLFPGLAPADIWVAAAIFQADFDRQDKHNHGRFVYRRPAEVPTTCDDLARCLAPDWCDDPDHCTSRKPSVLMIEGLDDSLVPNHATDSSAWQLGNLPHLEPVQRAVPFLNTRSHSVSGNVGPGTTAAFYQYVPNGVPGIPITPGCQSPPVSERTSNEGHYCAQSAVESRAQRLIFFQTAIDPRYPAPVIVDPLPFYPEGTPLFPLPTKLP